ncbi:MULTISPECIES: DUF2933 domain-containing protein [Pseudomonas]|uniref:DUF2933 domain-containing protein n=1 Tax=Pseudomonas frederiksbergensis TaxID=104087 RepID=A0AB33EC27_9PSED|nr:MULTISPECIES: DUF2933 domain-containing protein [Pseudomonas]ATE77779.1 DUF2933 domain-containing protein [Pseudomonas frederiksbergensis]
MRRHYVPHRSAGRVNGFFLGFLAIAGYFLLTEHRAHVIPYLPFLLLLACPLMHLFMHRGHGGHGGHEQANRGEHDALGGCCGHQHRDDHAGHAPESGSQSDGATQRPDL